MHHLVQRAGRLRDGEEGDINKCVMIHYLAVLSVCGSFLPRDSIGCEASPRSQKGPLCQPSQVPATRSLQTLSLESHGLCSGEQKTAPVHIVLPDLLAKSCPSNHLGNNSHRTGYRCSRKNNKQKI